MSEKKDADRLAQLEAEVAALKAAQPKPAPKSSFVPITDAENRDWVHQMRERRMSFASNFHPDDLRAMEAAAPTSMVKEIALRDARGPTSPSGMIPTRQASNVQPDRGTGYVEPRPLTNPPGTNWVDAIAIADEVRQRAELARKLGKG